MDEQKITKAKGRPMLTWVGKKPLDKIDYFPAQEKEIYGDKNSKEFNQLFWGDNLQVLSHLLKDYRGAIDLIYIDPPFDSKADYVKKVKLKGQQIDGEQQSILEEKQYTDIWENDEYLQFMYERLLIMKELLAEEGSIYLHCDWHRVHYLRCLMDEVFGEENCVNEIIWKRTSAHSDSGKYGINHDDILFYKKTSQITWNLQHQEYSKDYLERFSHSDADGRKWTDGPLTAKGLSGGGYEYEYKGIKGFWRCPLETMKKLDKGDKLYFTNNGGIRIKRYLDEVYGIQLQTVWTDIFPTNSQAKERNDYPTQKPEALLERIIKSSSNEGGVVLDCFCGSGTTLAVAQKLGRKWIGCDINIGAVQTTTKRLAQIVDEQIKKDGNKLIKDDFKGLLAFKVLNVNDYDIFKNEVEAKDIVMDTYGIEPVKRTWFDGELDNNLVKIMPLNRVLNKLDIKEAIKNVTDSLDSFTPKTTTKTGEDIYKEGVILICTGSEIDAEDYLKKENNTGVNISIRNILNDKKNLIFKKKPEAKVETHVSTNYLTLTIKEFYSPILMRKLELENEKLVDKKNEAKVEDFKQIIDSVAIDIDYDGKLFNAEIMDLPDKKEIIKGVYKYTYSKKGNYKVAVKIIDVLGEEYFETFEIKI